MSDVLYSIKESTLTDIGDALRRKHGETEWATVTKEQEVIDSIVSKSKNSTGFGSYGGEYNDGFIADVIKIDGAVNLKIKVASIFYTGYTKLYIKSGEYTADTFPQTSDSNYANQDTEIVFKNTDTITILYTDIADFPHTDTGNYGYYAEVWAVDDNDNPTKYKTIEVETEEEVKRTYKSSEMAQAIDDIEVGEILPEEAFVITGNCQYRFTYNSWNWFLDLYGDKISTNNISNCSYMFYNSNKLTRVPFDLNVSVNNKNFNNLFSSCEQLNEIGKIKVDGVYSVPTSNYSGQLDINSIFNNCYRLREIPYDFFTSFIASEFRDASMNFNGGNRNNMFNSCYSLRELPDLSTIHSGVTSSYNSFYNNTVPYCHSLNKVHNFPVQRVKYTSNMFPAKAYSYGSLSRINEFTFETQEDGTPYTVEWTNQIIRFENGNSATAGMIAESRKNYILNYNSGITEETKVTDDTSYQALKDNPDWWTMDVAYSRYNHDSAVSTINSLPDASAFGGANTIVFYGEAGSKTDGGAINTLTAEEIAVATAKGWTVSFETA